MDLFPEIKGIIEETLDWEFLCPELGNLEELEQVKKDSNGSEGLACRRYILERLDQLQRIATRSYKDYEINI